MKTHEQLNREYTLTLKQLKHFCGHMIRQTGRGAPEHARVCDLRVGFASRAFGKGTLYTQTCPASYQRIALADPGGLAALHYEVAKNVSEPLVLLMSDEQHDMEVVLHQHFSAVEFVFLPKPLPAVLLS